jgi:hypothetical protein
MNWLYSSKLVIVLLSGTMGVYYSHLLNGVVIQNL